MFRDFEWMLRDYEWVFRDFEWVFTCSAFGVNSHPAGVAEHVGASSFIPRHLDRLTWHTDHCAGQTTLFFFFFLERIHVISQVKPHVSYLFIFSSCHMAGVAIAGPYLLFPLMSSGVAIAGCPVAM